MDYAKFATKSLCDLNKDSSTDNKKNLCVLCGKFHKVI